MAHRHSNPSTSTLLLVAGGAAALYFLMSGGPQVMPPARVLQLQRNLNRFWDSDHQLPVTGLFDRATAQRFYDFGQWMLAAARYAVANDPNAAYYLLGKGIGAVENPTKEIIEFKVSGTAGTVKTLRGFYEYMTTHNITEDGCNDRSCWFSINDYYAFRETTDTGGPGATVP